MEILKIVKIGGNIIDDKVVLENFLTNFSQLTGPKILVHGGGKLASKLAKKLGVKVQVKGGRRLTDTDTLDIITMVYAGKINKNIVALLQGNQCNAMGFSGADGNSLVAKKRPVQTIDFGFVGDIKQVNIQIPEILLKNGVTPVFCAISHDEKGQLLNTNADTIASELAIAFSTKYNTELYYCFEKNGVLSNITDENSVIEKISPHQFKELQEANVIAEGMIPKLENCFLALEKNVKKISIGKPCMLFDAHSKYTSIEKS